VGARSFDRHPSHFPQQVGGSRLRPQTPPCTAAAPGAARQTEKPCRIHCDKGTPIQNPHERRSPRCATAWLASGQAACMTPFRRRTSATLFSNHDSAHALCPIRCLLVKRSQASCLSLLAQLLRSRAVGGLQRPLLLQELRLREPQLLHRRLRFVELLLQFHHLRGSGRAADPKQRTLQSACLLRTGLIDSFGTRAPSSTS
jgi:hypothetical protein